MEDCYETIVLPPPPRKPKGKAAIENHVKYLETHLIERLKEGTYTSLDSINQEMKKIIADINQRDIGFERKLFNTAKTLHYDQFKLCSELDICCSFSMDDGAAKRLADAYNPVWQRM